MKIINFLCVAVLLVFSICSRAERSDSYVSPHLIAFGYDRSESGPLVRWMYFDESTKDSCFDVELIEPVDAIIVDKLGICGLYVDDLDKTIDFQGDVAGYEISDVEIGRSKLTFKAEMFIIPFTYRKLSCYVPFQDKKIQPVECVTIAFDFLEKE